MNAEEKILALLENMDQRQARTEAFLVLRTAWTG